MNLNIGTYYAEVINYFQHNIDIAIALAGVFMLLLLCKPKLFFLTLVLIVVVNISALYVISKISLGEANKKTLIKRTLPCKTNKTSERQENITE
jgi:hypothetical protein